MASNRTWRDLYRVVATGTVAVGLGLSASAFAAGDPIKIGVISEESAVAGASISKSAQLAADEINAHGGVDGRPIQIIAYDDHSSASDGVRAFQRAATQDKVVAVIGSYISEVALAMEPWSGRLKMPFITPGAASNDISKHVHDDYDHYKYTFHGWMTSAFIAQSICDFSHDVLVDQFKMKTTVVMSEDAAWTKPLDERFLECLPKAGLQVLDHIRFNPDTSDFTPIFNQIEAKHPDTITTGISHVGVQPTVQWHDQQVPIPLTGQSSQATTTSFWKDTNGATEAVTTASAAAPGVAMTPKTVPFIDAYQKKFGGVAGVLRLHELRPRVHPRGCDQTQQGVHRSNQIRRCARKDGLCRHDRPLAVLRPQRSVHACAEVRAGLYHRHQPAMAGRQAGRDLAKIRSERHGQVPGFRQGAARGRELAACNECAVPPRGFCAAWAADTV